MRAIGRSVRRALLGLIAFILVVIAAVGGAIWLTLPPGSQSLAIPGLTAPVSIALDAHGIPFIRAANLEDAATALGYLHARDRMFQMALLRRLVAGRLAEWFGPAALSSDEWMRTLGLERHAEATLAELPPPTRRMLDAYARGVNAWIRKRGRWAAPQFLLLGAPRPWTAVDSLCWGEWMSYSLSGNWRTELARLALVGKLPVRRILALWPAERATPGVDAALASLGQSARRRETLAEINPETGGSVHGRLDIGLAPRFPAPYTSTRIRSWVVQNPSQHSSPISLSALEGGPGPPQKSHDFCGNPGEGQGEVGANVARPKLGTRLETAQPESADPETASNEWAVAGSRSATGAPLLAGDPHLGLNFPSLWYLARIETPDTTLVGATAPGGPFLVLGHNRHIAWTFTDTGADTEDLFVEQALPGGRYETPQGPEPFGRRKEIIHVRGRPDVTLTVRTTRHGPVISDLIDPHGPVLAIEMAGLAGGDTAATGLLALNEAKSVAAAGKAAAEISTPVLNLLVADRNGIGFFMTGRLPIRNLGDGAMPADGASGTFDWTGFAQGPALPHIVDPPSGALVNANNRIGLTGFPVFITRDSFGPWRARRIRELLAAHLRATVADFATMQTDVESTFAEQLLPVLERVRPPPGAAAKALDLIRHWDGRMATNLPQPLIFNAWIRRFRALIFAAIGVPDNGAAPGPEFIAGVLGHDGHSRWCGAGGGAGSAALADCAPLLAAALARATAGLSAEYGPDPAAWRWGQAHQARFVDPVLARVPLLGWLTACPIATPGDDTTVDRASPAPPGFRDVHGPEYRGVYDLADLDRSRFMIAPGQAGDPFARHACDLVRDWRDGRSFPLGPTPARVSATIRLRP